MRNPSETILACQTAALFRAAARPPGLLPDTRPADDGERIAAVIADPVLREAIAVSSPSLGRVLDEVAAGKALTGKRLRRAVRAVSRYQRRMSDRATPFGLMAGVAAARFGDSGDEAAVRWDGDPVKVARPSQEWLTGFAVRLEQEVSVLRRLRVTVNNLVRVRGDRLCLSYRPASGEERDTTSRELSLRCTPPVRTVLRRAARPVPWADLRTALKTEHSELNGNAERLLTILVRHQVLLTDLMPPAGSPIR